MQISRKFLWKYYHMEIFVSLKRNNYRFWKFKIYVLFSSVQLSSVTQSCPALCDAMSCSTPGLPVQHQLPEPTQTHVHWVGDAIQPFHTLLYPSPPALNLSQHQGLFKWISSSHQVARILEWQIVLFLIAHVCFHWFGLLLPLPWSHFSFCTRTALCQLMHHILPAAYERIFHCMIARWSADIWLNRNLST